MKYFKTVYIVVKNRKGELQTITTNCFNQARKIKQYYQIGGNLYNFGKIVDIKIEVNRAMEMRKTKIIGLHKLGE